MGAPPTDLNPTSCEATQGSTMSKRKQAIAQFECQRMPRRHLCRGKPSRFDKRSAIKSSRFARSRHIFMCRASESFWGRGVFFIYCLSRQCLGAPPFAKAIEIQNDLFAFIEFLWYNTMR